MANLTFLGNTGSQTSTIPAIHCYIPPGSAAAYSEYNLSIHGPYDALGAASVTIPNHWVISWKTDYDGKSGSQGTATLYYYNVYGGHRTVVGTRPITPGTGLDADGAIDTTDTNIWKPGEQYCVLVIGSADGVNSEVSGDQSLCRFMPGSGAAQYIKLE
jgi:hypothetical protein